MIPFSESDGIGASLQRVVCAWCNKDLGAQVCVPEMANTVSHGMCPACSAGQRAKLANTLVPGVGPENAATIKLGCGISRVDAATPAPLSSGSKTLETIEAASAPGQERARVTGISAHGVQALSALEHLSRGPAASFSFSAHPLFWCVTGYDFARSIAWAKRHGNPIADQIRARRSLGQSGRNF